MSVPKNYRTIEEFEREEIRPHNKIGFSFEDLMQETCFHGEKEALLFDDQADDLEPAEKETY